MIRLPHKVTVVHPGATSDRYGGTTADWTTATRTSMDGWVQQRTSILSQTDGRNVVVSGWKLFLEASAVIAEGDRLEYGALTFIIDGDPHILSTPTGPHHLEVSLRLVEG